MTKGWLNDHDHSLWQQKPVKASEFDAKKEEKRKEAEMDPVSVFRSWFR